MLTLRPCPEILGPALKLGRRSSDTRATASTMDPTSGYFHPFLGVEFSGEIRGFEASSAASNRESGEKCISVELPHYSTRVNGHQRRKIG